jgi:S1-C subfamily serine protease
VDRIWLFGADFTNAASGRTPVVVLLKVYPKTPAAEAGFRKDDVILAVDRRSIRTRDELVQAIEHSQGTIVITYWRGSEKKDRKVTLRPVKPKK